MIGCLHVMHSTLHYQGISAHLWFWSCNRPLSIHYVLSLLFAFKRNYWTFNQTIFVIAIDRVSNDGTYCYCFITQASLTSKLIPCSNRLQPSFFCLVIFRHPHMSLNKKCMSKQSHEGLRLTLCNKTICSFWMLKHIISICSLVWMHVTFISFL